MSATNRGAKRNESDFYSTPEGSIQSLLDNHKLKSGAILECAGGNGVIIKKLRENGYKNFIIANELREEENANLIKSGADMVIHKDFTQVVIEADQPISTIISNPPYSGAQEFLETCFTKYPSAEVIMLLRLNFLGSQKRKEFWAKYPPSCIYALSKRPSFTNKGTDATDYGWFCWSNWDKQEIKIL